MKKIIYILLLSLTFVPSYAQWSSNNTVNNSVVVAPNNQATPKIISDMDGGVIIVWQDNRTNSSSSYGDIYAQRFDRFGVKQWGDTNGLSIAVKPILERYYEICTDGKGGIIILWEDNPSVYNTIVKAQRVAKNGTKLWSDTGYVVASYGNRQATPRVAYDNNGGCYYTYYSSELSSNDYEIKANRLDSLGNNLWGTGNFICQQSGNPSDIAICSTADNGFIAVWGDPRNAIITETDLYAQKVNSSGTVLWQSNGIPVCTKRFSQQYQKVMSDNSGGAYVAWTDRRDSISNDIYVQRLRANGTFAMVDTGVALSHDNFEQYRPELASDMKGGVIVGWFDYRNGPDFPFNIDIYGQRVDSTGNIKWTPNGLNVCDAQYSQINTAIMSDGNYGAVYTWDDRRAGTSIYDIYAQRVDSAGTLLWGVDDAPISIATGNQYKPQIAPAQNGFVICCEDTRNGINNYDVFCQKAMMNGSTILLVENTQGIAPNSFELYQNYPNPFNPSTTIKFTVPELSFTHNVSGKPIQLKVYDILGKEVATLVNMKLNPGTYTYSFNARNLSSGIYFYKLEAGDFSSVKKMTLIK